MFSFGTLSIFATVAFSAFTSAVPVASPVGAVAVVPRDAPASAVTVLTQLNSALKPLVEQLSAIKTKDDATPAKVSPIIDQVKEQLNKAIAGATALQGQQNEAVPLQNVAKLLADVLILLISALAALLKIVGPTGDLVGVLGPVGPLLTSLLTALIPVVAGLVVALIPLVSTLLASVSALVTSLGLGGLIVALGL